MTELLNATTSLVQCWTNLSILLQEQLLLSVGTLFDIFWLLFGILKF